jgi:hypothetical protein
MEEVLSKLYPQCHPYWFNDDGTKETVQMVRILTHTSTGYIVPCCRTDLPEGLNDEIKQAGLLDEELKLANNTRIEDIMLSPQWIKFHKILLEEPDKAPSICHKICGKPNPTYLNRGNFDNDE